MRKLALFLLLTISPSLAAPNIIIFMTDDQGIGDLSCYGAKDIRTPNLDRLAASGARFANWYAAQPVCSPSRAAVLTGRYPIRAGVPNIVKADASVIGLKANEVTLAEVLKTRGYRAGIVGKWHLGSAPESRPIAQGFDYYFGFLSGCIDYFSHTYYWGEKGGVVNFHDLWRNNEEVWENGQYFTELITREAERFLSENKAHPLFLFVPYNAPHYPMHAPRQYLDRFKGLPRERQVHAAMIAAVDDSIDKILELLRTASLIENTLIFFQSDNGATIEARVTVQFAGSDPYQGGSNAPFRGHKFSLFEGGIRMPAMISWPGKIPAGQVIDEVGIGMDIFVTAAQAAGAEIPGDRTIDGKDILPTVTSGAQSPHAALFWAQGKQRAVRKGNWKLIVNGSLGPSQEHELTGEDTVFLADLQKDPGETTNLRRKHPQVGDELSNLLQQWEVEVKKP